MLWLFRHGESLSNAGEATSGYSTIPLTERGHSQAQAIVGVCPQPARIVLSRYTRARQTAEPMLARFPDIPTEEADIHEFTYLEVGRFDNTSLAQRKPWVDSYWSKLDPEYCDGPEAETFVEFLTRGRDFLDRAASWSGDTVAFSHEQFIRVLLLLTMSGWIKSPAELMRRFYAMRMGLPIPNASLVRMEWNQGRWWIGGVDTSHLSSLTT
ncbi:histidine phosphatase family protein [Zavarzinella formosa]|uniref:histidine phosphatase family protein n=1 Tax=Zavarzinella formosa TaxID=360055 RepID=UPI000376E295|nr:histidine phosphatase family protein [Zavarzinella formosa]